MLIIRKWFIIVLALALSVAIGPLIVGAQNCSECEPITVQVTGNYYDFIWITRFNLGRVSARGCASLVNELKRVIIGPKFPPEADGAVAWVDVVNRIAYFRYMMFGWWWQAAILHEAAHVRLYEEGRKYYGAVGEHDADVLTAECYPEWSVRSIESIPDNGPIPPNPRMDK